MTGLVWPSVVRPDAFSPVMAIAAAASAAADLGAGALAAPRNHQVSWISREGAIEHCGLSKGPGTTTPYRGALAFVDAAQAASHQIPAGSINGEPTTEVMMIRGPERVNGKSIDRYVNFLVQC